MVSREKQRYVEPELKVFGSIEEITMGAAKPAGSADMQGSAML